MSPPTALVTGGLAASVLLSRTGWSPRGFHVVAVDGCAGADGGTAYGLATRADIDAVAAAHAGRVTGVVADVRDPAALAGVVEQVRAVHGGLSVVVAGAAVIAGGAALWETEDALLDAVWRSDAVSVWNTAKATLPLLLEQPADARPTFVAITSAAGEHGLFHLSAYCMAKHAVVGLVRALAADVAGHPVTVAGVSPGSTSTDMLRETARLYGLADVSGLVAQQAIGRALEPDEVASVVEFACTAGPVVHGSILAATGGFGP